MTVADEGLLILRQTGQQREFPALHRRFDAPQAGATHQHFVCGEDQAQVLLTAFVCQFRKRELIERQQQALFSGYFDFDCASVRIARPAFVWFGVHG